MNILHGIPRGGYPIICITKASHTIKRFQVTELHRNADMDVI